MHYRKYFIQETGLKLNKNLVVHHKDFDRKNNNIENLIALPSKLHDYIHRLNSSITTLYGMSKGFQLDKSSYLLSYFKYKPDYIIIYMEILYYTNSVIRTKDTIFIGILQDYLDNLIL